MYRTPIIASSSNNAIIQRTISTIFLPIDKY
jgi:hypothetical protein